MNIVAGVILLIISTYLGFIMADKYTLRKIFYTDFLDFNKKAKNEINFSKKTVPEIIKSKKNNSDFYLCLNNVYIEKKDFCFSKNYLINEEKNFLSNYIQTIGSSDKISQLNYLDSVEEQLKEKVKNAENDEKKYKKTYIKLAFLIGLIILIILL